MKNCTLKSIACLEYKSFSPRSPRPVLSALCLPSQKFEDTASLCRLKTILSRLRALRFPAAAQALPLFPVFPVLPVVKAVDVVPVAVRANARGASDAAAATDAARDEWEDGRNEGEVSLFSCLFEPVRAILHALVKDLTPMFGRPVPATTSMIELSYS